MTAEPRELRWEWTLPSGETVTAVLDPEAGTESVFVDDKRVSACARGGKPEGHAVGRGEGDAAPAGVVTFDPRAAICVLREPDGHEITPTRWPERTGPRATAAPPTPRRLGLIIVVLVVCAIAAGGFFALRVRTSSRQETETLLYRADNGLFVAHFPARFAAKSAVLPSPMGGVVLEDQTRGDVLVIVALPATSNDPWVIHQHVQPEALVNVPRADGRYDERARKDALCHGEPGAVVLGRVNDRHGQPARLWSCTFVHDGTAYLEMYSTADATSARDEASLLRVLDATDLTHLEELMGPKH
jgi:hypothetical protein